jgi:predicted RNase H-like HicB family nuclease
VPDQIILFGSYAYGPPNEGVIEEAPGNYSAYVPDLPGCVATGATVEETQREIRDAIKFHLEWLRDAGEPIPEPTSQTAYVEV